MHKHSRANTAYWNGPNPAPRGPVSLCGAHLVGGMCVVMAAVELHSERGDRKQAVPPQHWRGVQKQQSINAKSLGPGDLSGPSPCLGRPRVQPALPSQVEAPLVPFHSAGGQPGRAVLGDVHRSPQAGCVFLPLPQSGPPAFCGTGPFLSSALSRSESALFLTGQSTSDPPATLS